MTSFIQNPLLMKTLKHFPALKSTEEVLAGLCYGIIANYDCSACFWSYLTVNGPIILVKGQDGSVKLVVLNQSAQDLEFYPIWKETLVELVELDHGTLINWLSRDKQDNDRVSVYGFWTADPNVQSFYSALKGFAGQAK